MIKKKRAERRVAIHRIKTTTTHFELIREGLLKFVLRFDDQDYRVGDTLIMDEYKGTTNTTPVSTGEFLEVKIIYILRKFKGLELGHVIMGIDN